MCTLRIAGEFFDVDSFLASSTLRPSSVFRKGEPRRPNSAPNGPVNRDSMVCITASDADWSDLPAQIREVENFLASNLAELIRIPEFPGVDQFVLDFPIELRVGRRDIAAQSDHFPATLVRAAGAIGLALELTIYG